MIKTKNYLALVSIIITFGSLLMANDEKVEPKIDTSKISFVTGIPGKYNEKEGVFKITWPKDDVPIKVDDWQMPEFMGLISWVSFAPGDKSEGMIMGDLVLFEDEVNSVMSAVLNNGLLVTALHNHFFFDKPKVFFMHITGEGSIENLAKGVKAAIDAAKKVRQEQKEPKSSFGYLKLPSKNSITKKPVEKIFESKSEENKGMLKFVFGREVMMECGCTIGKDMGINSWAAFAGLDDNALVDGDLAVLESELQKVLKSLRASNINVVAIHNHMIKESPRLLFVHYFGRGSARHLAKSLKEILESQKKS